MVSINLGRSWCCFERSYKTGQGWYSRSRPKSSRAPKLLMYCPNAQNFSRSFVYSDWIGCPRKAVNLSPVLCITWRELGYTLLCVGREGYVRTMEAYVTVCHGVILYLYGYLHTLCPLVGDLNYLDYPWWSKATLADWSEPGLAEGLYQSESPPTLRSRLTILRL